MDAILQKTISLEFKAPLNGNKEKLRVDDELNKN